MNGISLEIYKLTITRKLLILSLIVNSFIASAQSNDSLIKELGNKKGEEYFEEVNELASSGKTLGDITFWANEMYLRAQKEQNIYWQSIANHFFALVQSYQANPDSAIALRRIAIEGFSRIGRKDKMARQYINLANIYSNLAKYDSALFNYKKARILAEQAKDTFVISGSYLNASTVYHEQGNSELELEYLLKSLEINKLSKSKEQIAVLLYNLSIFYIEANEEDKAKELGLEALEAYREINSQAGEANVYTLFARIQADNEQLDSAFYYMEKAGIILKASNSYSQLATVYLNQGELLGMQGELEESIKKLDSAYQIFVALGEERFVSFTLHDLSAAEETRDLNKSIKLLEEAIAIVKRLGILDSYAEWNKELAVLYHKNGKYEAAFLTYQIYVEALDSLTSVNNQEVIQSMEAKYQNEKKQLEIDNLEKDKELQQAKLESQKSQQIIISGGLGVAIIIIVIVSFAFVSKRKDHNTIKNQKLIVEQKNDELEQQKDIVEEKNREITDSITYAKRIQKAILPPEGDFENELGDGFVFYLPKSIVAGDFYWMPNKLNNDPFLFAAADCTGHGVPGAMVSVICSNALNRAVNEFSLIHPSEILDKSREIVIDRFSKSSDEVKDGMDIALCALYKENNVLEFSGAQNPIWIVSQREIEDPKLSLIYRNEEAKHGFALYEIKGDKQPVGLFENQSSFTNHSIQLEKGDSIYLFSDGFADQFGGDLGKKLKNIGLKNLVLSVQEIEMKEQKRIFEEKFFQWKGDLDQIDDVCVIGMKV